MFLNGYKVRKYPNSQRNVRVKIYDASFPVTLNSILSHSNQQCGNE